MPVKDTNTPLINRIFSGDKQAEAELFSKFWRTLYFIVNQRCQDPDLAADIAQEAIIITIKKARAGEISNPAALSSFIRNTAQNLIIADFRKQARQKNDPLDEDSQEIFSPQKSTEQLINQQQVRSMIQQVLDELPTIRDKEVLQRHFSYGHSKDEVCHALDLTPAHFDRVVYRAKNRLKQLMITKHNVSISNSSMHYLLTAALLVIFSGTFESTNWQNIEKVTHKWEILSKSDT